MIFYALTCKIRYGKLKQSVLMATHRLIFGYKYKEIKINLSNMPKSGSVVFVKNKPYMVSHFGKGTSYYPNQKIKIQNHLSLIEINDKSIPKFKGHGIVYSCDVQQELDSNGEHSCPCDLLCAIV